MDVEERRAVEIVLNSDKISRQTRQETENFNSLRESKTLLNLISKPDQVKREKGSFNLKNYIS